MLNHRAQPGYAHRLVAREGKQAVRPPFGIVKRGDGNDADDLFP
jgi:hypothetical protein